MAKAIGDGGDAVATADAERRVSPRKVRAQATADWPAIEAAYVLGTPDATGKIVYPGQAELAAQFGVGERTVAQHCTDGKWREKRQAEQRKLADQALRERRAQMVQEAIAFDNVALVVAKAGLGEVLRAVNMLRGQTMDAAGAALLDRLMGAADRAQKVGRLALSLPTDLRGDSDEGDRRERETASAIGGVLGPDEQERWAKLEDAAERGDVDVLELYRQAGGLFAAERAAAERSGE